MVLTDFFTRLVFSKKVFLKPCSKTIVVLDKRSPQRLGSIFHSTTHRLKKMYSIKEFCIHFVYSNCTRVKEVGPGRNLSEAFSC